MVILYSKKFQVESEFRKGNQHGHFILKQKFKSSINFKKGISMVILYSKKFKLSLNFKKGSSMVILYSKKFQVESEFQKGHQHGHFILKKNSSQV